MSKEEIKYPFSKYFVDDETKGLIRYIQDIVNHLNARRDKGLSINLKTKIFQQLKISQVYNSNAIEGNLLTVRETELILNNLEINDKPLKDQIEAKTLSKAIDFLQDLISGQENLSNRTLMELHQILMADIPNVKSGKIRNHDVKIKGSGHEPPQWFFVQEHLDRMFEWYNNEKHLYPIVKGAIIHHWLTWIHPFEDGNGRISRLFLNFFFLQNGYPEVVVRIEDRDQYYMSLEHADSGNLTPLIELIIDKLITTVSLYEEFLNEEEREKEWVSKYTKSTSEKRIETLRFNYEVWKSAMEVFRFRFEQSVNLIKDRLDGCNLSFRSYDIISFNQYLDLLEEKAVSNTWYFTLGLHNYNLNKKTTIIFYFERFYPTRKKRIFSKKENTYITKKTRDNKPIIKLYPSARFAGHSKKLNDSIRFQNVGMLKDKLVVGIKKNDGSRFIESKEAHLATPIIRELLDQLISIYLK